MALSKKREQAVYDAMRRVEARRNPSSSNSGQQSAASSEGSGYKSPSAVNIPSSSGSSSGSKTKSKYNNVYAAMQRVAQQRAGYAPSESVSQLMLKNQEERSRADQERQMRKEALDDLMGNLNKAKAAERTNRVIGNAYARKANARNLVNSLDDLVEQQSKRDTFQRVSDNNDREGRKIRQQLANLPETELVSGTGRMSPKAELDLRKQTLTDREQSWLADQRRKANAAEMEQSMDRTREYAARHPMLGAGMSTFGNILGSAVTPVAAFGQKLSGEQDIDINSPIYRMSREAQAAREGTQQGVKNTLGISDYDENGNRTFASQAADFGTGTALSMVDTLVRSAFMGPMAGAVQSGLSAGSQGFIEAKQNGADDAHAMASGIAQGVAEQFFEKYSLEGLHALKADPATGIQVFLRNVGKQALTEGSEEFFTDWANAASDYFINGGESEWKQRYDSLYKQEYANALSRGYSEEEAKEWANNRAMAGTMQKTMEQSLLSFLGGAVSGGILGGGTQIVESRANIETGRQLAENNQEFTEQELRDAAASLDVDPETYTDNRGNVMEEALEQAQDTKSFLESLADKKASGQTLTEQEQGAAVNEVRKTAAMAENAPGFAAVPDERSELYVDEHETDVSAPSPSVADLAKEQEQLKAFQEGRTYNATRLGAEFENAAEARDAFRRFADEEAVKMSDAATQHVADLYGRGGTANAGRFIQAYKHAYVGGLNNMDADQVIRSMPPGALTDSQLMRAYQDGLEASNRQQVQYTQGPARQGGLAYADNSATKTQKRVAQWIGNKTGLRVEIREGLQGGGEIDIKKGVMRINPYSRNFNQSMAHELTHLIRQYDQKGYESFSKLAVQALMESKNMTYDEVYAQYERTYAQSGTTPRVEDVIEEMTADASGQFLNDEDFVRKIVAQDRSLGEKIIDFFNGIIDAIQELISTKSLSRPSRALRENLETYTKARDIWMNALDTASERYRSGLVVESDGIRYDLNEPIQSQINRWKAGDMASSEVFYFGRTPQNLTKILNISNLPLMMTQETMIKGTGGKHSVSFDEIANIRSAINDPLIVFKGSVPNSYALITRLESTDRYPILIALHMDKHKGRMNVHEIASFYGKDNIQGYLDIHSNEEELKYVNKEKINDWSTSKGLQLPELVQTFVNPTFTIKGGINDVKKKNVKIAFNPNNLKHQFEMDEPVEQTRDLIAIHNKSVNALSRALDLGGLPMPSIAIVKADQGHDQYGPVSMIFRRSTIDPEASRLNKVYTADAWTPTFPRVDTEINSSALEPLDKKLRTYKDQIGGMTFGDIRFDESNFSDYLSNNNGDIEKVGDNSYDLKLLYLEETGDPYRQFPTHTEEVSYTTSASNEEISRMAPMLEGIAEEPKENRKAYLEEHADEVIDAYEEITGRRIPRLAEAKNKNIVLRKVSNILGAVRSYSRGDSNTREVVDYAAAKTEIDQRINDDDYHEWIRENLGAAIGQQGIPNGVDPYDRNGNRKSFRQTHMEFNLDNLVKAMRKIGNGEGAFAGGMGLWGVSQNEYGSVDEIKADSGRLQQLDPEEMRKTRQEMTEELAHLAHTISDKKADNSFIAEDTAATVLIDGVRETKDPKKLSKYILEYTQRNGVTKEVADSVAKDMLDLADRVKNLPTDYFEAKPERAVRFDEVAMVILPDDVDPAVIDRLKKEGVASVKTYPADNEAARQEIIRNASDLKFQLDIDDDTDMAVEDNSLVRNNPQLRTATQTLGELLSAVDYMPSDESIERTARQLKKSTGTSVSQEEITAQLKTIYNYIAYNGHVNGTDISNIAADYAGELINKANNTEYNQADQQSYKEFRDTLKGYTFHVPAGFEGEINRLGGIAALRREFFGTMNLTKEKGVPIDTMWQELVELYPQYFDPEVSNPADQLEQLVDTIRALKPKPVSMFQNDEDMELYRYSVGQQIFQAYTNSGISDYSMRAGVEAQVRERMKNLQGKYQQQYDSALKQARQQLQEQRQAEKLRKMDREAKQYLLKQARELVRMKGGPAFEMAKQDLIKDLDLVAVGIRSDTVQKLQQLRREVDKQAAEDTDYAELEKPKFEKLLRRLENRHISDMSAEEIADLTQQIVALKHSQQTANRILKEELGQRVATVGRNLVEQQTKIKNQGRGIDATKTAEAMAKNYVLNMQSPMRALQMMDGHRKDGVLTSLAKDLNDGQTKKERFIMESEKMFREVLKDQELVKTFSRPDIEITDSNGRKAYISKGMRISLYLHSQNHQNMDHIGYGGVRIPNERLYKAGKYQDAYNAGQVITLKPTDVRKIISQMTDAELAYAEVAKKFFNEKTKAAINETSMILNGYEKATVANYFPIRTDPNFTQKEMSGLQMDGTIEGMGSLKERQEGAKNPILLEDVSQVIMRQMENTARYYGFAIPVRNFNKIWNYTSTGYGNSSKNAIIQTWGGAGSKYIENLVQDLQTGGRRAERDILDKLKSRYAGTALNLNLGVAIKQSASAPVAALVLDTKSVMKAFAGTNLVKKIDYDYIDSITPWSYSRRKGMSGTEVGETARQRTMVEMMDNGKLQKAKGLFNWIQNVDVWTTDRLILACEYYMEDHHPSLKKGTAEYDQKLGELIQEVFQRTQPSYDVMQRSEFLRSTGALSRVAGMFKTQTFNMGGEFLDALTAAKDMEVLAANGEASLEDVAAAKKQFYVKTVPALIVSQAMLAAFQVLADAVLHRMKKYRDKDGEVTAASVGKQMSKNFISSFPGLFMGGAELGSMIGSAYSSVMTGKLTWYDITLPALDSVNDMASSIVSFGTAIHKVMENGWTDETQSNFYQKLADLGMSGLIVRGIPASNIYNILNAGYLHLQDVKNGEFGTFEAGNSILGLKDSNNSRATLYSRTFNRLYEKGDWDGFITEFNRMQNREGTDKANKELIKLMRETDEVQAAAQALMDGDKDEYQKNRQALIDKGFKTDVFRADITTAIQNEYAKLKDEAAAPEIGRYGLGNIDLYDRPQYVYPDGAIATVESMSFEDNGEEVLIPTIGRDTEGNPVKWTDDEAIDHYYETGEYLGKFQTPEEADEYAIRLHNEQAEYYHTDSWNGSDQLGGYKTSKLGAWIEDGYDEYDYIDLTEATKGFSSDKDKNGKDIKGKTKQDKIGKYLANRTDLPKEVREAFWDTLYSSRKNMPKMK